MVPFSPTRPPHAEAGPATTTTVASASATKQTIRRMASLLSTPPNGTTVVGSDVRCERPVPGNSRSPSTTVRRMPDLHVRVDARVLAALDELAHTSGAPRDHLVERALAEYL